MWQRYFIELGCDICFVTHWHISCHTVSCNVIQGDSDNVSWRKCDSHLIRNLFNLVKYRGAMHWSGPVRIGEKLILGRTNVPSVRPLSNDLITYRVTYDIVTKMTNAMKISQKKKFKWKDLEKDCKKMKKCPHIHLHFNRNKTAAILVQKCCKFCNKCVPLFTIIHNIYNSNHENWFLREINGSSLLWKISYSLKCWLLLVLFIYLLWEFAHGQLNLWKIHISIIRITIY